MADINDRNRTNTDRGIENQAEGKAEHLKGHVNDAVGGLTGDTSQQLKGKFQQAKGTAQDKLGELQRKTDENV
jgi:uncharacterized protein YjbJ (UPF0337 family)